MSGSQASASKPHQSGLSQNTSNVSSYFDLTFMTGLPAEPVDTRLVRWDAEVKLKDLKQNLSEIEDNATKLEENNLISRSQLYLLGVTAQRYSLQPHGGFVGDAANVAMVQNMHRTNTLLNGLEASFNGTLGSDKVIDLNALTKEERAETVANFTEDSLKWGTLTDG